MLVFANYITFSSLSQRFTELVYMDAYMVMYLINNEIPSKC
jgi:hypothetical protein